MSAERESLRLERFLELPIGGEGGIPEAIVPTPTTSLRTDKPAGRMRAPVRLRAAPDGELLLLAPDPAGRAEPGPALVLGYSREGTATRQTPIEPARPAPGWRLVDFAAAADGSLYLLEQSLDEEARNHLRRLSAGGEVVWHRSGSASAAGVDLERLDGEFDRILVDLGGTAYLSAARREGVVARIDASDGSLKPYADWGTYRGEAFMAGNGDVYYVQYLPQTGRRYWVRFDPRAGEMAQVQAGEELTEFLARPVGVDDRGRAYGVSGPRMACMDAGGSLAWLFGCEGLVPGSDGDLWTSLSERHDGQTVLEVQHWAGGSAAGRPLRLALPAGVDGALWRLVRVDDGQFAVFGGETPARAGLVLTFTAEGELRDLIDPAPPDTRLSGSWLQPPTTWSVALDGSVYLPVAGADRLAVVRLTA